MRMEEGELAAPAWGAGARGRLTRVGDQGDAMPCTVDLRPLLSDHAATHMLMLARGQLNRAFRAHGLRSPDPMLVADASCFDAGELDDPAASGSSHAQERYGEAFVAWTQEMPSHLAGPVAKVLRQVLGQLPNGAVEAVAAVTNARDFCEAQLAPGLAFTRLSHS